MDQKEAAVDEVWQVSTRSSKLPKDVEQTTPEVVAWARVEMAPCFGRRDANEEHTHGLRRYDSGRIEEARWALDGDTP
jgi:hypothetical protein